MIRWISTNDDLPPKNETVLVYLKMSSNLYCIAEAEFNPEEGWNRSVPVLFWAAYPNVPQDPDAIQLAANEAEEDD